MAGEDGDGADEGWLAMAVALGVLVLLCALRQLVRWAHVRQPGMVGGFNFRPFTLLAKQTLVEADAAAIAAGSPHARLAVRRLTFRLPAGTRLGLDTGLGEFLRVLVPGGPRCGPGSAPKSYSPTAEYRWLRRPAPGAEADAAVGTGDTRHSGADRGTGGGDGDGGVAGGAGGEGGAQWAFDLVIKVYPGGRTSSHLDALALGEAALMSGPYPPWAMQMRRNAAPGMAVGIVACGVGITEALPVARAQLAAPAGEAGASAVVRRVVLVWQCRTAADVFWRSELRALLAQYGARRGGDAGSNGSSSLGEGGDGRFRLVIVLSREPKHTARADAGRSSDGDGDGGGDGLPGVVLHGRVTPELLRSELQGHAATGAARGGSERGGEQGGGPGDGAPLRVLCVGTRRMRSDLYAMVRATGLPHQRLLRRRPGPRACCC